MLLESDISYVYEKLLQIVKYDETIEGYIVLKKDYMPLKLTNKQLKLLRRMCKVQGIYFEEELYKLPSVEAENLFNEYNEIKRIIDSSSIPKEKHPLNKRRIEIRNKIVTDNLPLVRAIVDRNFDAIPDGYDKEELYQLGYEMLLTYVDNGNILQPRHFTISVSSKLIHDIKEKILNFESNISDETKKILKRLQEAKRKIISTNPYLVTEQLSTLLNIEPKKVEEILNIDRFLEAISIDTELEQLDGEENDNSPLYNSHFETELIKRTAREIILKIIKTLPTNQQEVLMLSYGFIDGRCYDDVEIGTKLGLTKARIGIIRHNALNNLRASIRKQYLIDYSESSSHIQTSDSERQIMLLEEILISYIPQEELIAYLNNIPKLEKDLIMLYYGLIDGIKRSYKEITKILNISKSTTFKLKTQAFNSLKNEILKQRSKTSEDNITYEEYLQYLIETYIIHNNKKR